MSGITTHVLDTSRGRPAAGVPVTLEIEAAGGWKLLGKGTTNADGRISDLTAAEVTELTPGVYRLDLRYRQIFRRSSTSRFSIRR